MPVSIKDVARHAGVSSATVSRVLAEKPHVRPEVRRRVLEAVESLGYQPNRVARSLRVKRSKIIGLVISDIQNPFFTALARAVEDVAYAHGYAVFLCNADEDLDKERLYLELMRAEAVAGVVMSPTHETDNACAALVAAGVPIVAIDRRARNVEIDTVVADNVGAAFEAVSHLIADGYSRIGAILPSPTITTGRERHQGFVRALEAHGLPLLPELVRTGLPIESVGYGLARELLESNKPPEALFTGNNVLTVGALKAIGEKGLSVPGDIGLAAFDDLDWMPLLEPKLTVVIQPTYEIGCTAATLLLQRLENPARAPQEVVLSPALRIGRSCKDHPASRAQQRQEVRTRPRAVHRP
jgi:DNA-binding LacI/PurR family transcriptional regulator